MSIYLGIDIGAISVKVALVMNHPEAASILARQNGNRFFGRVSGKADGDTAVLVAPYRRTRGRPLEAVGAILGEMMGLVGMERIAGLVLTGSGSDQIARKLAGVDGSGNGNGVLSLRCNEFQAICQAVSVLQPAVRTVFEMGGETSKYLRLEPDPSGGHLSITDYGTNGDCAAGTGSFLDQQAGRLKFMVEQIGDIVAEAERSAQIAGRCSVFAKSDMIHAQQKGFTPPEVLRGLCKAVATNFKSAVVKGRIPDPPIILIGGVSANSAVVNELRGVFDLDEQSLWVPESAEFFEAIGAALLASDPKRAIHDEKLIASRIARLIHDTSESGYAFSTSPPLILDRVRLLRDQVKPYVFDERGGVIDACLGLDIGSVGTKLVVIDEKGDVVYSIFTRTEGRPIEVVTRCLKEIEQAVGTRIRIRAVGTTGSGRELIGELVGADSITDEITCHKTGASFVGDRLLGKRPDTIFEIGGQDSKYISLESESGPSGDTIVVDFTMNEACAAGTGSVLEERAEELGVAIKDEFSREAFKSSAPIKLGERCTVFMERDVNTCMHRGAKREDVIAGLAYSVVYNYINRVVRGRPIGQCIFFQGGTAYNDAVAAAFSIVTGKEIIVPPHNAILGAIGAALLAREKVVMAGQQTRFRGYNIDAVDYSLREFVCKGCGNHCSVQEFNVEGEKTFWGDKCSDRYRKRAKTDRVPVVADLVALRRQLLMADDQGDPQGASITIGVPMAMYAHDLLPLYRRFFRDCGFRFLASEETNRQTVRLGYDSVVAEPCFPIIVAHGHVAWLAERNVDYVWLPNIVTAQSPVTDNESHVCPWGQTLPFFLRQAPAFRHLAGRILCPTIRMQEGPSELREAMIDVAAQLRVNRRVAKRAFDAGWNALQRFRSKYQKAGQEALDQLTRSGEKGIVLVGRPYNLHDPGVTLATARKLRDYYGVNLIPIDALPIYDIDVRDINHNMYWEYGRRILATAKLVAEYPNLHIIYLTNFKCGPDSFVKGYVRPASGKPFLTLQFDGHSNDAGMMTRCEAYLDSKGILRWWRTCKDKGEGTPSKAESSISHKWLTPAADLRPHVSDRSGSTPGRPPIPTAKPSS